MEEIIVGDIVQLKTGSIDMTVTNTGDGNATCEYFKHDGEKYANEPTQVVYPVESLRVMG